MTRSQHPVSRHFPPKKIIYNDGRKNLLLRPYEPEDAQQLKHVLKVTLPSLYKYMLWPVKKWDFEECARLAVESHADYFGGKEFEWGIFDAVNEKLLGSIGIMPCTPFNDNCYEIGYWTSQQHLNKGIATIATKVIIAVAFECLQVTRLQATTMTENVASIRVIENCNFQYEGALREFYPKPSEDRIKKGAKAAPLDYLYSLLPKDCQNLEWYPFVLKATSILPMTGRLYLPLVKNSSA